MKPMESPTAGLEVVQASRTQQAFQIRQQLLQFGLLFWGAPMTLTGITSYPLTTVGVSYLFSKQAPT
jgi:non-ribosomal peptide synthetase component E (peptide arylation enzyme)